MDANKRQPTTQDLFGFNPRARDGREKKLLLCNAQLGSFNPRARDGRELAVADATL